MKVLIVDDEEMAIKLVEHQLKLDGFDIITTTDGREAMELIKSEEPDLVISDIMMPVIS